MTGVMNVLLMMMYVACYVPGTFTGGTDSRVLVGAAAKQAGCCAHDRHFQEKPKGLKKLNTLSKY